jgi:glycosyltransferase involved in cell wall biosynthesis
MFHVVGLPSSRTSGRSECAFTALTGNFIRMMKSLGHQVVHYGVGCDETCDEDVVVGHPVPMDWTGKAAYWELFNKSVVAAINKRKKRGDFVCVINGCLNQALSSIDGVMVVEYAIGYNGTFANYRVFASYAHMHKVWGAEGGFDPDGKFYDVTIPHYLDPTAYPMGKKGDYYLYIGRLTKRKGVDIAVETCKRLGFKLKLAGLGERYEAEHVGFVTGAERLKLYQGAIATFAPTLYVEPFNMTVLEAQMTGTPVITTDWGSYPELVEHGKTGYRCRTLEQFMWAAQQVQTLDPEYIRQRAIANYSLDRVRWMYDEYFKMLLDLWDKGWYTERERTELDWLVKV